MVNIGTPYNPGTHKPIEPRDPLLPSWYAMQIIKSEVKKTVDQQSQLLELTFEIVESMHPELKGRKVWERLNLWNTKSQKAIDFANAKLSSLCKAIGQLQEWTDSDILHNRPVAVKLKVRAADGKYDAQNEVSDYDNVASRFQAGMPVTASTTGQLVAPPPPAGPAAGERVQIVAPGEPMTPPAQQPAPQAPPPPQGQPGEVAVPPWQQK